MNKYNPQIHHRKSIRLQGYDYSMAGLYFITICIKNRECLFGNVTNGEMALNEIGKIADDFLKNIPHKYHQTQMHEYVVMPNHVHAIIEITGDDDPVDNTVQSSDVRTVHVGAIHESPLQRTDEQTTNGVIRESPPRTNEQPINRAIPVRAIHESPLPTPVYRDQRRKMLLSKIMGWYKMNTAKQINIIRQREGVTFWQRNYYDHIIRNEQSYQTISDYIINNPIHWTADKFYIHQ